MTINLLESQIQENNANIESERQQLRARQIDILKQAGQPNWQPTNTPAMMQSNAKRSGFPSNIFNDAFKLKE